MALSQRLDLRQTQGLVMTPQLMQAIKLLQLSHLELSAYIEAELERNPLLDRDDDADSPLQPEDTSIPEPDQPQAGDWAVDALPASAAAMESRMDTDLGNVYQDEAASSVVPETGLAPSAVAHARTGSSESGVDFTDFATTPVTLHEHLERQLHFAVTDPQQLLIGQVLIDAIDEAGYMRAPVEEMAQQLGTDPHAVETVLDVIQRFDPCGVGARTLPDCLALQLRERDRLDPAMQALLDHLDLLARRDYGVLMRLCGVDQEDLSEMISELRALTPKPGLAFSQECAETVVADVMVRCGPQGDWIVELNPDTLPRVLINHSYYAQVSSQTRADSDRTFLSDCLSSATWLTRALDQRAKTILKVASEIVRQQDAFLAYGIRFLRPLTLKSIADAIGMHESTVSRVTANKYLSTPRGLFEMKYFFSASISSSLGGEAHSAEAVRHQLQQFIDAETADHILSDDVLVEKLKEAGIDIARRTVAKYREAMKIPPSSQRRREKKVFASQNVLHQTQSSFKPSV